MNNVFQEYHQFTDEEYKQLWKDGLFVFDTNTLLNMYRYSRDTVTKFFKVLHELNNKSQLWIPYQVGYEFYENRVDVICEYENSYDSIITILNKAKDGISQEIANKFKDHPILNLCEIKSKIESGISEAISYINDSKTKHPKLMEQDDILIHINQIFKNNIGKNYDNEKLSSIIKEGKERYEKNTTRV